MIKEPGGAAKWRQSSPTGPAHTTQTINQYLPDARHVLDRFHVVRWFTQGLTLVRRELQHRDPELRPPTFEPDLLASPLHPPTPSRPPQPSPPSTSQQDLRRSSPSPNRVRMPSSRALPAIRSRQPGPGQRNSWTLRRPLRHRPDTANTTKSWTPSSHGENRSWPTTPPDDGYPTDPSKEPTTSTQVLRRVAHGFTNPNNYRLFGFQWGVTVARRSQLGFPA